MVGARCSALVPVWLRSIGMEAVAATVKGYSGLPDSARLVHAIHALLGGLGVRAWFEDVVILLRTVRTSANVSVG
jgi:hypothetical protein